MFNAPNAQQFAHLDAGTDQAEKLSAAPAGHTVATATANTPADTFGIEQDQPQEALPVDLQADLQEPLQDRLQERRERFAARMDARRDRLQARAQKATGQAESLYKRARSMASVIPFGQPILVGHHSEGRDRRYRAKIHNTFGAAFKEHDKAAHYAQRAEAVGTAGISSDDPDALAKLREQLAQAEAAHARMKRINKHLKAENLAALRAEGLSDADIAGFQKGDFAGRKGYAPYELSNSNQRMARLKARIAERTRAEQLREAAGDVPRRKWPFVDGGGMLVEDFEANRVYLHFDRKPEKADRQRLGKAGFRWTSSISAWGRQLHAGSMYVARQILSDMGHSLPALAPAAPAAPAGDQAAPLEHLE